MWVDFFIMKVRKCLLFDLIYSELCLTYENFSNITKKKHLIQLTTADYDWLSTYNCYTSVKKYMEYNS